MTTKEHIVKEFRLRVFQESFPRIEKCLSLISEEELWFAPNENMASVGNLILHLAGNARQWVVSGIGGGEDARDRDTEFVSNQNISKEEVFEKLTDLIEDIDATFNAMTEEHLNRLYTIQDFEVTGFSVLVHVIEHFSYHTGQISLLTKLMKNQDLGYYDDFDLNV